MASGLPARSRRPLIGVTGPDEGGWPAWFFTRLALLRCGARALRITPNRNVDVSLLDGLVLGGGADVTEPLSESLSPAEPGDRGRSQRQFAWKYWLIAPAVIAIRWLGSKRQHGADVRRDSRELWLLERARERGLPVFGICRGAQLMSVASGGTLERGLDELYEERARLYTVLPRRQVRLEPGSLMQRVLGRDLLHVNSLHHHAIRVAGDGLCVAAREPEGIVQAVERQAPALWWGVQWHPEYLPQSRTQLALLRHWVETCRETAVARGVQNTRLATARDRVQQDHHRLTPR